MTINKQRDEESVVHMHNAVLFHHKEEWKQDSSMERGGTEDHVKQTKSDSEGKLSHFVSYSELRFQCSSDEMRRRTVGGKEAGSVGNWERAGNRTHLT